MRRLLWERVAFMVFLTGCTGFLGSHLLEMLINAGNEVHCLVRPASNLKRVEHLAGNTKFITLQDCDYETYFKDNNIKVVMHCATNYGRLQSDPVEIVQANLILPLQLLHAASRLGIKAFVNTDTILDKGINSYSLSKKQFCEWLRNYSEKILCINIALEHFYGPNDDPSKFTTYIVHALLNDVEEVDLTEGEQKRDFIYIDDVAGAIMAVMENLEDLNSGYHHFEVGTGKSIKIKDFVHLVKNITKNEKTRLNFGAIPYRQNEVMDSSVDIGKLAALGWKPKYTLEQGLIRTIETERNT